MMRVLRLVCANMQTQSHDDVLASTQSRIANIGFVPFLLHTATSANAELSAQVTASVHLHDYRHSVSVAKVCCSTTSFELTQGLACDYTAAYLISLFKLTTAKVMGHTLLLVLSAGQC